MTGEQFAESPYPYAGASSGERRVARASLGQASLWFLRQVMPYPSSYNTAVQFRLVGDVDASVVLAAVREVCRRHESCRTTFGTVDGTVMQVIHEEMSADATLVDATSAADPAAEAVKIARAAASEAFDLERGPLVRVRVVRIGASDHALVVVMDHIIADGLSLGVIWRELEVLYRALRAGQASPLPPPQKQFAQCVGPQEAWLETQAFAKQLDFWKQHLAGAAPCDLPTDRPRPPIKSYRGDMVRTRIPRALVERLETMSRAEGVSLFTSLLAGLEVLLARYSGQNDISVLVPVACRNRFGAEDVIGYFANVLVLRNDVSDDASFRSLLTSVRAEVFAGLLRQDVPFERVVEKIGPERSLGHDPLASVGLSFLPTSGSRLELPGVVATYEEISNGGSKFDLQFFVADVAGELTITTEYNADIFDHETVERLNEHYGVLLEGVAADPTRRVSDLPMLTAAEQQAILHTWNETAVVYPRAACLHERFEAQASATPEAVAVVFDGESLDYRALNERADRLAARLARSGVGVGSLVGIATDRTPAMVVGLLGILKTGAAYVPIDPGYPRDRIAFVLRDAKIAVLVTEEHVASGLPQHDAHVVLLDAGGVPVRAEEPSSAPVPGGRKPTPADRAYVIYTSGSTGTPKGVEVPHRAVVNFLSSMANQPGCTSADHLLAVTSLSFDIAGLELWLPLTVGARVEIASRATATHARALRERLDSGEITLFQATPSTFRLLIEAGWQGRPDLKVLVGGEALPPDLADALVARAGSAWNMYGPTETTIWSTLQRIERGAPVLVGRPIANTQTYVLDRRLAPVPVGVTGELYIGGMGVALGYLGRPDLTAERFVPDPFSTSSDHDGAPRLYRTGDLARQRPDGALELLGRADFQIKLRGHRIELGEIEATLIRHGAVREAVVVVREEGDGDQRLVAYLTTRDDARATPAELRAHLAATLPEYMLPSRFIQLDALPLTANGKIDRKALPSPLPIATPQPAAMATPRGALEIKLCAIWEEVLGIQGLGVHDDFFELGGHSLLALKLFDRIARTFGVDMPIASLFHTPTVAGLASLLRREGWTPSWSSLVPIQTGGSRTPLFCVHAIGGNVLNYRLLSRHLGDEQPFYGLQARGLDGETSPHDTVEEMAAGYIHEMRQEQSRGPYVLGGASSGGVVAFEMAQQLHAAGEQVSALLLLDTCIVGPHRPRLDQMLKASPLHRRAALLDYHFGNLLLRTPREGLEYLTGSLRARFGGGTSGIAPAIRFGNAGLRRVIDSNRRALASYVPQPYAGSAVMLLSRDEPDRAFCDGRLAWADLLGQGLTVRFIPGSHENMLDEPQVAGVAAVIARCLG